MKLNIEYATQHIISINIKFIEAIVINFDEYFCILCLATSKSKIKVPEEAREVNNLKYGHHVFDVYAKYQ